MLKSDLQIICWDLFSPFLKQAVVPSVSANSFLLFLFFCPRIIVLGRKWDKCSLSSDPTFHPIFTVPQPISLPFLSLYKSFDISLNAFYRDSHLFLSINMLKPKQLSLKDLILFIKYKCICLQFSFFSCSFSCSPLHHFLWAVYFPNFLFEVTIFM